MISVGSGLCDTAQPVCRDGKKKSTARNEQKQEARQRVETHVARLYAARGLVDWVGTAHGPQVLQVVATVEKKRTPLYPAPRQSRMGSIWMR